MAFLELFFTFFLIGLVTFGGGYAMLPMIQEQVALRWGTLIPPETLTNFVAVSESTPGPFAINMATYVGTVVGGEQGGALLSILGAFCATLGVVTPSFIIILIVAKIYEQFKKSKLVKGAMSGLKPAVVGLIANAIFGIVLQVFAPNGFSLAVFSTPSFYVSLVIFVTCVILAFKKVHPIVLICLSAVLGIVSGYLL
jgi:chromate transporter